MTDPLTAETGEFPITSMEEPAPWPFVRLNTNLTRPAATALETIMALTDMRQVDAVNIALNMCAALLNNTIAGWDTYQERETTERTWWGTRVNTERQRIRFPHLDIDRTTRGVDRG